VVLSGEPEALEELLAGLEAEQIRARMIPVDYAAHSAQVEAIRAELLEGCGPIEPQEARVPFLSTVTAQSLDTTELDAEYWYRNLRETVRFEAVTELEDDAGPLSVVFVESGGDNLTAAFSPALADVQIFVLDCAGGIASRPTRSEFRSSAHIRSRVDDGVAERRATHPEVFHRGL